MASAQAGNQAGANMTLVGCLMSESDYRKAHNLGSGALGGVGLGDEFVLVDATVAPSSGNAGAMSSMSSTSSTGSASTASGSSARRSASSRASGNSATCTESGSGQAYRLTGHAEEAPLKALLGHRVEVTGHFKNASDASASARSGSRLPVEVVIASYNEAPAAAMTSNAASMSSRSTSSAASSPSMTTPSPSTTPNPDTTMAANTSSSRRELSHTASPDGLIELIGFASLAGGLGLRLRRRN